MTRGALEGVAAMDPVFWYEIRVRVLSTKGATYVIRTDIPPVLVSADAKYCWLVLICFLGAIWRFVLRFVRLLGLFLLLLLLHDIRRRLVAVLYSDRGRRIARIGWRNGGHVIDRCFSVDLVHGAAEYCLRGGRMEIFLKRLGCQKQSRQIQSEDSHNHASSGLV